MVAQSENIGLLDSGYVNQFNNIMIYGTCPILVLQKIINLT